MVEKIFVTGGAGFIGSSVAKELLDKDYLVVIYDNLSRGHEKLIDKRAEFIKGDLLNARLLKQSISDCDAVIHFAGLIVVPESIKEPKKYFENNLTGSVNLLDAMSSMSTKKIVFSSSAAVYGEAGRVPVKEDDIKIPTTPYGHSKLFFENYLSAYYQLYGIESTSLRCFNAYGPNELHKLETHAIPNFIINTLKKMPINVFGDGEQIRDFVFIRDMVDAHILALEKSKGFNYYNVGYGKGTSINELTRLIFDILGQETNIKYLEPRAGDPIKLIADISKIKKELSWYPKIDLKEGLKQTIEWFKKEYFEESHHK